MFNSLGVSVLIIYLVPDFLSDNYYYVAKPV